MQQKTAVRQRRRGGRKKIILIGVAAFLALCIGASAIWLNIHYSAGEAAMQAMQGGDGVTVSETDGAFFFDGKGTDAALVFYPGGKVDSEAYAPLMKKLAAGGVDCFLLRLPFRLAVLDRNAADRVVSGYDYKYLLVGGHSLGGVAAASYSDSHADKICGSVLLASYPSGKMSENAPPVLSVYGTRDGVMDPDKFREAQPYLPPFSVTEQISGGNHAGFGDYGAQDGDNEATITADKQQEQTAALVFSWVQLLESQMLGGIK